MAQKIELLEFLPLCTRLHTSYGDRWVCTYI